MVIQLFDANWQPVSNLIEASSRSVTRIRVNQATTFSFTFPSDSVKATDLDLAAHVLLLGRLPGRITSRRVVGGEVHIEGLTLEDRLNDYKTPRRWVAWNDRDLADVVRDILRPIRFVRWSTAADWQGAVEAVNVDLTTEPGSVLLATDLYLGVPRYRASGYIVLRAQLPATALPTGKIVRWTERVGSKTRIKIQTRAAATEAELVATPWGPELEATHADGIEDNETKGVPAMDGGPWVEVRANLYTEDRDSTDGEPVTIMGVTPILDGLELIYRMPPVIGEGSIPASTGVIVRDTAYDRVTHLRALIELCEKYGFIFRIRLDGNQPVLDLAQGGFGIDRSADVRLINGENCTIVDLRETDQQSA